MDKNRRNFLKAIVAGSAVVSGALLLPKTILGSSSKINIQQSSNELKSLDDLKYPEPNDSNISFGMVIDLDKCDGCEKDNGEEPDCASACRDSHNVPQEMDWIKIYKRQDNPFQEPYFFPRICQQCENPPCVEVCPVGAALRRHDDDGLVLINHDICIGCRLCMTACPYETRYFNWEQYNVPNKNIKHNSPMYSTKHIKGTTDKCDFCGHRGYLGEIAHCASACKNGALYYGNLKENLVTNSQGETLDVKKVVNERNGYRYKEELGTNPRVFYLPRRQL
ncbi:MAG: Hdr-like menaquinol oxidoreductase iron-sulfur subunit 1 precursor [Candidatus Heimdallarchaeota archaeon LC_3]|nr:MAG: Hdr-like menaquinol oxidoreductase iron-sulfur subunit 1 precursor [Candidatus Heimdallarchaeota archaeon LC_3]